jgi:hypothetical protein
MRTGLAEARYLSKAALGAADADRGASVVLIAVVREFAATAEKAVRWADAATLRDVVIELAQAAESATAAADADPGAREPTRQAVITARDAACVLTLDLSQPEGRDRR